MGSRVYNLVGAASSPRWGGRGLVASIIAPRAALLQASRRGRVGRLVPMEDFAALAEAMCKSDGPASVLDITLL